MRVMNCRVDYKFDEENKILFRNFSGIVNINDLVCVWVDTILNHIPNKQIKGIVSDFRGTDIQIEITDLSPLEKLFSKHIEILTQIKIAEVLDSPKIVLPILFKRKNEEFQLWPFTTIEAALNWINN